MNVKPLIQIENLSVEFALGRKLLGEPPILKAVNEHATRERQMSKAIKNMDQVEN